MNSMTIYSEYNDKRKTMSMLIGQNPFASKIIHSTIMSSLQETVYRNDSVLFINPALPTSMILKYVYHQI